MDELQEIPRHEQRLDENGVQHTRIYMHAGAGRMFSFELDLSLWARIKVLFGWCPVVRCTAHDGLDMEVGELAPPLWWSLAGARSA